MTESDRPITEPTSRPERADDSPSRMPWRSGLIRDRRIGAGALVALAALMALVVWLIVDSGGDSSKPAGKTVVTIVSEDGARTLANALGQPIYWVGRRPDTKLELSQLPNGGIYIRYLPSDAKAGDRRTFLTIGTYPMQNAFSLLQRATRQKGSVPVTLPGGVAVSNSKSNVYVAFPGSNYQIEVYAPKAGLARQLVAANRVRSITAAAAASGTAPRGPVAASVAQLKALSERLGQPIYWAGSQPNVTYELTRTSNGRIFIRYLPAGVPVGANALYLTIGTYPVPDAFSVTQRAGKAKNTAVTTLPDGAIAVYAKRGSTHVYLAYPGSNQQIEVFDPTPGKARRLVTAARISPVR